jgi:DNA-binding CsgD family transcriptional regulator
MVAVGQDNGRLMAVAHAQSLHDMRTVTTGVQPVLLPESGGYSRRRAMECLGRAIANLFECSRCFVAVVPRLGGPAAEQVRMGYTATDPMADSVILRIASRLSSEGTDLLSIKADDILVRSAIGVEDAQPADCIMGRINSAGWNELVFVAGWRTCPLTQAEISGLSRATRVIWSTADYLAHSRREGAEFQNLLEELVFPAFVVDEYLRLREVNRCGKKLLLKGEILSGNDGFLKGATRSVTQDLREAVRNALTPRLDQRWTTATIVLATGHQKFAFAWVGAVPIQHDGSQVLIIVPRIDEAIGARRIATAFSLNCVEEKIIARILHGQCPRVIGAELGLTEATVRTYTKRIMLKLGINRQSELFLLYILTLSPFGSGRPEKALSNALRCSGLNGRAYGQREN